MAFLDRCLQFFVVFLTVFLIPSEAETTDILLPLNDTVTLNFSATCHDGKPRVTYFFGSTILNDSIKESRGLKTNVSSTNCCPANVNAEITVPGIPLNNGVEIGIQNFCGNNISAKESSHWSIILQGISSVENIQWSNDNQSLSWSTPFYSDDITQGTVPTYNVLVNGISVINTTDTSVLLNVSPCIMEFNVSIVASVGAYQSTKTITILNNNYSAKLLNYLVFYNSTEGTVSLNITFQAKSTLEVCGFEYFVSIMSENEYAKNYTYMYSTQEPLPPNKKQIIISEMVHDLELENYLYTVQVTFNVTKDILNFTISSDIANGISASPTISSTLPTYSLFSSTAFSSISSSSAEQSGETPNISSSRYTPTPTGSFNDGIIIFSVVFALVLFVVLIAICCLIYYLYNRKKVSHSHEDNIPMCNFTRKSSKVFESDEKNDKCALSQKIAGANGSHDNTDPSTVNESSMQVPNPPLTDTAASLSEPTEVQYSSSPHPSSDHEEICHICTPASPEIVPTESTVLTKTGTAYNNKSNISDKIESKS